MTELIYSSDGLDAQKERQILIEPCVQSELDENYDISGCSVRYQKREFTVDDIQDIGFDVARKFSFSKLTFLFDDDLFTDNSVEVWVKWLSFGLSLAGYRYKHSQSYALHPTINVVGLEAQNVELQNAHKRGCTLAIAQTHSRELMNKPANQLYPETFVKAVEQLQIPDIKISAIGGEKLTSMGFGGMMGVAQGSEHDGQLLTLDYNPEGATTSIVLIGKGVTFDSGGISIKGAKFMSTMKFDMGGAASVVGALYAISQAKLPVRVIGLCGLVENMPSGKALKPGDVVTMLSGENVEIISTDAEGRMVLADVLYYAQETYNPDYLLDIATLTGGVGIALGKGYSALMSNSDDFVEVVKSAGSACGERVWPMPIGGWFNLPLKSDYADLQHGSEDPHGSPCVAATFLSHFVRDNQAWVHIDSAAMSHNIPHRKIYDKAATGYGALLLSEICHSLSVKGEV
ncbi:M17 family metallopeptidase [Vibrio salinus]|uniref:M17 family metallopeptidase n=1 Tax=Vibrio salinus TaxID=2899784 RepID=UPI001E5E17DF|nr:leucyl aminopeptidase family protein [Vibrio salinus]MCE0496227.1 leucyl aminopeptidase family protein [Vibrio salinus]